MIQQKDITNVRLSYSSVASKPPLLQLPNLTLRQQTPPRSTSSLRWLRTTLLCHMASRALTPPTLRLLDSPPAPT
jgi:hypothetical protein